MSCSAAAAGARQTERLMARDVFERAEPQQTATGPVDSCAGPQAKRRRVETGSIEMKGKNDEDASGGRAEETNALQSIVAGLPENVRATAMRLLEEERARWYTEGRKDGERLGRMQERRAECGEVDQGSTDESDGAMTGITRVLGEGDRTRAPCTGAPGTVIGSIAYTDELSLGGEFFNGDAGAYEQREFVEPSVAENPHWRQGDPVILAAARKPTTHFIWSVEEYNTPIPLGRYGQPHLESSAWEDFNPIRLWKEVGGSKVERGDSFW
ncbi:hypothetical protein AURDEDRAFT_178806, partial [Auricularia subglabra TFB-10046 SS5]